MRQRLVHDATNDPKRMVLANPRLKINVTEQRSRPLVPPRIRSSPPKCKTTESQHDSAG